MKFPIKPLHILIISVHGLIRSRNLELGRDADTGGQTLYVVELVRALAALPEVGQVDLLTRRVVDAQLDSDYAERIEIINDKARIVRLDAGPEGYIPKEELWDHLDSFADNALAFLRSEALTPNLVHSHYADAGYVGVRLSSLLGVPLVHTGHSLGRVKRGVLLASGVKRDLIETRYHMARRIKAEELTLSTASLVIASTANEIEQQYAQYDHYQPRRMRVIPPGTDLQRFHPPTGDEHNSAIAHDIARFLNDPDKPIILALSRPDERKNIATLVRAYGESSDLQALSNLVIVAGNRDDIRDLNSGAQTMLNELLLDIDRYDLYGKVAYPKHHRRDEVSAIYRLAAQSGGVFINPALTEPFGLTLIEAAASGLPIVATADGGPQDIINNCQNGYLIDPLNTEEMVSALLAILQNSANRMQLAQQGLDGVARHYAWSAHAKSYLGAILPLLEHGDPYPTREAMAPPKLYRDRALFTDLDENLLGDTAALDELVQLIRSQRKCAIFGIATGRSLESTLKLMRRHHIPMPDVLICSQGTEIHFAPDYMPDKTWLYHIDHLWTPNRVRTLLDELPGLSRQPREAQSRYKLSYFIDPQTAPALTEIQSLLHQNDQTVNVTLSFGQFLDVLPIRASKGFAVRWFADQWDVPLERILVVGGAGADADMVRGNTLAVVVSTRYSDELYELTDAERIYFAHHANARGILEGIEHYDFFGQCHIPHREIQ